jgi:hypothetical protein
MRTVALYIQLTVGITFFGYGQIKISHLEYMSNPVSDLSGYYITDDEARKFEGDWIASFQEGFIVFTLIFEEKISQEGWGFAYDAVYGYSRVSANGLKPPILISDPKGKFPPYTREADFAGFSEDEFTLDIGAGEFVCDPTKPDQLIYRFRRHEWLMSAIGGRKKPWWVDLNLPENEDIIFTRMVD